MSDKFVAMMQVQQGWKLHLAECERRRGNDNAASELDAKAADWRAMREWAEAADNLASYAATCRRTNQHEWMEGLVEHINNYLEKSGDADRISYDVRADWIAKARGE